MKIQRLEKFTLTITFTFIVIVLFMACTSGTPQGVTPETEIKIGVVVYNPMEEIDPLSIINSADMAVEEINTGVGLSIHGRKHKVTWIRENVNAGVPEESVAAVQRLINQQNVVAVIGPLFSVDAIPAGEIAEISGIPLITPLSTNPRVTIKRKFVFRMGFLDDFQGSIAAIFTRSDLQVRRAAVLYDITDPYSRGLAKAFKRQLEEAGGQIVAFESFAGVEDDILGQLNNIKEKQPEILYLPNFSEETKMIAVKAREMKIKAIFMGGDSWDLATLAKIPEFEGAYMTAHYSYRMQSEINRKFVSAYRERFDLIPRDTAALSYDAFQLVFESIKYKDSADPGSIRDGLYAMGPYEGVGGYVDFVENGDPVKGVVILQLKDGEAQFVGMVGGE